MGYTQDTIAAISTPLGRGGIGIIRLSGSDSIKVADRLFKAKNGDPLSKSITHRTIFGHIYNPDNGECLDEVIVTIMRAPGTYTREDVVEINCHAGTVVLKAVLEAAVAVGARLAEPGEFTKRAYLNGRIDLTQAEAVSHLINARSETAARIALRQIGGTVFEKIKSLRDRLIAILAHVEAAVDFSDEDIEIPDTLALKGDIDSVKEEIQNLLKTGKYGKLIAEGLSTVIIGRVNVGKSSLMNALLDEERAIVTPLPGTTRDMIEKSFIIDGISISLNDTAGIREAGNEAEEAGVGISLKAAREADLILFVVDGSVGMTQEDVVILTQLDHRPIILVINKSDLPAKLVEKSLNNFRYLDKLFTSAINGQGLAELKGAIADYANGVDNIDADVIITNVRQEEHLRSAAINLDETLKAMASGFSEEILAESINEALANLGKIVGATDYDDLLDEIFSRFCIGK